MESSAWIQTTGSPSSAGHPFSSLNPEAPAFIPKNTNTVPPPSQCEQPTRHISPAPFPIQLNTSNFHTIRPIYPCGYMEVTNFPENRLPPQPNYVPDKTISSPTHSEPLKKYENDLDNQRIQPQPAFQNERVQPIESQELSSDRETPRPDHKNSTSSWQEESYHQSSERSYDYSRGRGSSRSRDYHNRRGGRGFRRGESSRSRWMNDDEQNIDPSRSGRNNFNRRQNDGFYDHHSRGSSRYEKSSEISRQNCQMEESGEVKEETTNDRRYSSNNYRDRRNSHRSEDSSQFGHQNWEIEDVGENKGKTSNNNEPWTSEGQDQHNFDRRRPNTSQERENWRDKGSRNFYKSRGSSGRSRGYLNERHNQGSSSRYHNSFENDQRRGRRPDEKHTREWDETVGNRGRGRGSYQSSHGRGQPWQSNSRYGNYSNRPKPNDDSHDPHKRDCSSEDDLKISHDESSKSSCHITDDDEWNDNTDMSAKQTEETLVEKSENVVDTRHIETRSSWVDDVLEECDETGIIPQEGKEEIRENVHLDSKEDKMSSARGKPDRSTNRDKKIERDSTRPISRKPVDENDTTDSTKNRAMAESGQSKREKWDGSSRFPIDSTRSKFPKDSARSGKFSGKDSTSPRRPVDKYGRRDSTGSPALTDDIVEEVQGSSKLKKESDGNFHLEKDRNSVIKKSDTQQKSMSKPRAPSGSQIQIEDEDTAVATAEILVQPEGPSVMEMLMAQELTKRKSLNDEVAARRDSEENVTKNTRRVEKDKKKFALDMQKLQDPRMERERLNKSDTSIVVEQSSDVAYKSRRSEGNYKQMRITPYTDHDRDEQLLDKDFALWEIHWAEVEDSKVTNEIQADLFEQPKDYSLAHCVAEDLRMGSGIAVAFKREFKNLPDLLDQRAKQGGLATLHDEPNNRFVYYLVTKRESSGKPTYSTLWKSLYKMREHIKEKEVKKLAVPRLGCGLDRLEWDKVKSMIEWLFKGFDIEIRVCNFQQNEQTEEKKAKCKLVVEEFPITKIEQGTLIFYLATSTGDQDDITKHLSQKFHFWQAFKQHNPKNLGDIVYYDDKIRNFGVCGCIVRRTSEEQISFKSLHRCIQNFNKMNQKFGNDAFSYVAFQWVDETAYFDDLVNQKIITVLTNFLRDVDVYICRGSFEDEGE